MGGPPQNPFRPGLGKCPPLRVGHREASLQLGRTVKSIAGKGKGNVYLMQGPPGVGKTSLLAEYARVALDSGTVVRVMSGRITGKHWELGRRVLEGDKDAGGDIPRGSPTVPGLAGYSALCLKTVLVTMVETAPMLLIVADAHLLDTQSVRTLSSVTQGLMDGRAPFALVLAGSAFMNTDFTDNTSLSFREHTSQLRLSVLERREVLEALSGPAESSGRGFDDEALALVARESRGYPLFVQMLGAAAWQSAAESGEDRISLAAAQDGANRMRADKEAFFAKQRDVLDRAGVLQEAEAVSRALVDAGEAGQITRLELDALLKDEGASDCETQSRIRRIREWLKIGLIRSTNDHAAWEPEIPGFFRYIAEHTKEQSVLVCDFVRPGVRVGISLDGGTENGRRGRRPSETRPVACRPAVTPPAARTVRKFEKGGLPLGQGRGMGDQRRNPFRPGLGKCPPLRVGHKEASEELRQTLRRIVKKDRGGTHMMQGPPGIGKTSLLAEHARMVLDGGAAVRVVSGQRTSEHQEFVRRVIEGDQDAGREIPRGGPTARGLSGDSVPCLRTVLGAMVEAAPMFLVVVDTHLLDVQSIHMLSSVTEGLMDGRAPFALVLAGSAFMNTDFTGNTSLGFREHTNQLRLSVLESREVSDALSSPAESSGRGFDDEALALVARESQGYPLFVQMLGAAAWQSAAESGEDRISLAAAQDGVNRMRADKEAFFSKQRDILDRADVLREAEAVSRALVDAGEIGQITRLELDALLRVPGASDSETQSRIRRIGDWLKIGLIRPTNDHAAWEPEIPGFFRHIAERAGE